MVTPTKKQKLMLEYIDGFIKTAGYSPTYREIMYALDYKSVSTVAKHIDNLIARGLLIKRDNEARTLEVVTEQSLREPKDRLEHKQWLMELIAQKESQGMTDEDRGAIQRTLEVLGLSEEQ